MAGSLSIDEVLPRMAEAAARGVGAQRSRVHVLLPDGGERSVDWPSDTEPLSEERFDRTLVIEHKGEPVGGVSIAKPPGDAITAEEDRLLADLASQAGLALQNVRLTAELQARLQEISAQADELRASRQRIVAAQDAAARRLERNIHDGAQQQLLSIGVTARLARSLASTDPARTEELLNKLGVETEEALQALRDLARGIYPSILSDRGVSAALEVQIRKFGLPVSLHNDGATRYSPETEAAVYFCCLEALQNISKHAGASSVTVRLVETNGWLEFAVVDDGWGFDAAHSPGGSGLQNMRDRLSALGGSVMVRSQPGSGTTVDGRVPATPR
jgi:signal transduction histidine kinase